VCFEKNALGYYNADAVHMYERVCTYVYVRKIPYDYDHVIERSLHRLPT
jgi:hypothetical protein